MGDAFTDTPNNAHVPQMHFVSARHPDVGVADTHALEEDFCDAIREKEIEKNGWSHDMAMEYPAKHIIPIFEYQTRPRGKEYRPPMADIVRVAGYCAEDAKAGIPGGQEA